MNPTGNITALVESNAEISRQPFIAGQIMKKHPEVEQVGFLHFSKAGGKTPPVRLSMSGGEFCGNASMCAAVLYAEEQKGNGSSEEEILLEVSGAQDPVKVRLQEKEDGYRTACVQMPPALGIDKVSLCFRDVSEALPVVRMQGISHVIIEEDSRFAFLAGEKKAAEEAVQKWAKEICAEGLGLMFLCGSGREFQLTPLVFIPKSRTVFWENSCGSGSCACGIWLSEREGASLHITFRQPGGDLRTEGSRKDGIRLYGKVQRIGRFLL